MAGGRRSGAERVLESRHLVGLFLGVVLLCGVFFTLGYVMGKTQFGGPVQAAENIVKHLPSARGAADSDSDTDAPPSRPAPHASKVAPADTSSGSAPTPSEWDFYTQKKSEHLEPAPKATSPSQRLAPAPAVVAHAPAESMPKAVTAPARYQPPRLVKGSIVLQIAALTRQGDALAMADELQQKRFPAFVVTPNTDNFYRVQVGPYMDEHSADMAKADLGRAGFMAITKR